MNMSYYSPDYRTARKMFLAAAEVAGATIASFRNACCTGPNGEELCTDVARIGPDTPDAILTLVSGTHGIEGFAGSACQAGFLRESLYEQAPPGTAFLLVHALNPHGFAYERRVNEDNVDLNRNFVDHANPPHNNAYDEIHAAMLPDEWHGPSRTEADLFLGEMAARRGLRYLQEAVTKGQYRHPDGLFYGGTTPVWSHRLLRSVVREYLTQCPRVAYIDLHTGLGARGYGEPIFRGGWDDDALERARAWYGPALTISEDGSSSSTPIIGNTARLVGGELPAGTEFTAITLEFGTIPGARVLDALRADNWLHLRGGQDAALATEIRDQMREAFSPMDCGWRGSIWAQAKHVFGQAFAGLGLAREEISA
jgi:predicted deacylase